MKCPWPRTCIKAPVTPTRSHMAFALRPPKIMRMRYGRMGRREDFFRRVTNAMQTRTNFPERQATAFVMNCSKQTPCERALTKDAVRTPYGLNSNGKDATGTRSERMIDAERTARTSIHEDLASPTFLKFLPRPRRDLSTSLQRSPCVIAVLTHDHVTTLATSCVTNTTITRP